RFDPRVRDLQARRELRLKGRRVLAVLRHDAQRESRLRGRPQRRQIDVAHDAPQAGELEWSGHANGLPLPERARARPSYRTVFAVSSSSFTTCVNVASGTAPDRNRPFTKNPGVPSTP